jgi:hypothetical protein
MIPTDHHNLYFGRGEREQVTWLVNRSLDNINRSIVALRGIAQAEAAYRDCVFEIADEKAS